MKSSLMPWLFSLFIEFYLTEPEELISDFVFSDAPFDEIE